MKVVILRKSNQLGVTANLVVKGMSSVRYNFVWDTKLGHFAYEPKSQKEIDDIFTTQGRIYRNMSFSIKLDDAAFEKPVKKETKAKKKQPVEKELEPA
jgi:hypothetical protein